MNQLLIAITTIIIGTVAIDLKRGDPCTTPNGESATCIPFEDCNVITKAISTLHPDALKFAQHSQCGFENGVGLICCGTLAFSKFNIGSLFTPKPPMTPAPAPEVDDVTLATISDSSICGIEAIPSYRIKGGKITKLEEFPWLVALEFKSGYDNSSAGIRCGGSLINHEFILTAAHCIQDIEFVITRAWLGVNNISSEHNCLNFRGYSQCAYSTLKMIIAESIPHEFYIAAHGYNDIGLLKLENNVQFNDYIRPICLPSADSASSKIGDRLLVAGWGHTGDHDHSDIKLKVEVPVQSDSICNELLKVEEKEVASGQLCAGGEKGKDSCHGDSGGPLIKDYINTNQKIQWYQEGIVSYGVGCGIQGRPAVYTKVARYTSWIISKTET